MDPTYPLAPIANFVACVLVLLPLFSTSIRSGSWNVAVTLFVLWTVLASIIQGVNAIIWSDNVDDVAPVWCDISKHSQTTAALCIQSLTLRNLKQLATHVSYTNGTALRACTFVLTRSLYDISICEQSSLTRTVS